MSGLTNWRRKTHDFDDVDRAKKVKHRPSRRTKERFFNTQDNDYRVEVHARERNRPELVFQVGPKVHIPECKFILSSDFDSNKGHHQEVLPLGIKLGKDLLEFPKKGPWRDLLADTKPIRNIKDGIVSWDYQVLFKQGFSMDLDWRNLGIWSLHPDCCPSQVHALRAWREVVDVLSYWTFKGEMLHQTDDIVQHMPLADRFILRPTLSGPLYDNFKLRNAFRTLLKNHPSTAEQEIIQLIREGDPDVSSLYGMTMTEWMTTRKLLDDPCPHFHRKLNHLLVRFTARSLHSACRKLVSVKGHKQRAQARKLYELVHELNENVANEKPGPTEYSCNFSSYVKKKRMRNRDRKELALQKRVDFQHRPVIPYSYQEYLENDWLQEFECDPNNKAALEILMKQKYTLPDGYFDPPELELQVDPKPVPEEAGAGRPTSTSLVKTTVESVAPGIVACAVLTYCGMSPEAVGVTVFCAYVVYLMHMWNLYNVQSIGSTITSIAPTMRAAAIGAVRGAAHYHATGEIVTLKKEVASALTDALASSSDWVRLHGSKIGVLLESLYGGTGDVYNILKEHKITFSALRHLAFVTLWLFNRRNSKNKLITDSMLGLYAYEAIPRLTEQSNAYEWWSKLLKLVSIGSVPLTAIFPRNPLLKSLANVNTKKMKDNLGDMTEAILDLLPDLWAEHLQWMRDPIKKEMEELFSDPCIEEWVTNPDETQSQISGDDELALKVKTVYRKMNALNNKLGLRGYRNHDGLMRHTLAQLKPLSIEAGSRLVKGRRRIQPLGIRLTGAPGGGKSELAHILVKTCMEDIGVPYQEHNTFVFNQSDKYWDTFSDGSKEFSSNVRKEISRWVKKFPNTDALIIDDFESSTDPIRLSEVHALLIDLINVSPLALVCAAVEKKGMKYFDAQMVIVTTNKPIQRKGERGISCDDAFHRRFVITAHVFKQYGFKASKPGAKELGNYYIRILNSFTGTPVGDPMTGAQFAEYVKLVNRHKGYFFEDDIANPPPQEVLAIYSEANDRGSDGNEELYGPTYPKARPAPLVEQNSGTITYFQAEKLIQNSVSNNVTLLLVHKGRAAERAELLGTFTAYLATKSSDELFELDYSDMPACFEPGDIDVLRQAFPGFSREQQVEAGILDEEEDLSEAFKHSYQISLYDQIADHSTVRTFKEFNKWLPQGVPSFEPVRWGAWSKAMLAVAIMAGLYCMYRAYTRDRLDYHSHVYDREALRPKKRGKLVFQNAVQKVQKNLVRLNTGNGTAHGLMVDSIHLITNKHSGLMGVDSVIVRGEEYKIVAERVKTWPNRDLIAYKLSRHIPGIRDISSNFMTEESFKEYFNKMRVFRKCFRGSEISSARLTRKTPYEDGGMTYYRGQLSEQPLNGDSGSLYVVEDPNNITGQVVVGLHTGALRGTYTAIITKVTKEDIDSFFLGETY